MHDQTHWVPKIIKSVTLEADSPKKAFYKLAVMEQWGEYWIEKESGAGGHVLDRRRWDQPDKAAALKFFYRKLNEKLKKNRPSPRRYRVKR